jgi:hypothetical protein
MKDRIHIFECHAKPMPIPVKTADQRMAFVNQLLSELPAFKYFLLKIWHTPKQILDVANNYRFPCRAYHHPNIVTLLTDISPATQFLNIMTEVLFEHDRIPCIRQGSSEAILSSLNNSNLRQASSNLVESPRDVGEILSELKRSHPNIVKLKGESMGKRIWRIYHPDLREQFPHRESARRRFRRGFEQRCYRTAERTKEVLNRL